MSLGDIMQKIIGKVVHNGKKRPLSYGPIEYSVYNMKPFLSQWIDTYFIYKIKI